LSAEIIRELENEIEARTKISRNRATARKQAIIQAKKDQLERSRFSYCHGMPQPSLLQQDWKRFLAFVKDCRNDVMKVIAPTPEDKRERLIEQADDIEYSIQACFELISDNTKSAESDAKSIRTEWLRTRLSELEDKLQRLNKIVNNESLQETLNYTISRADKMLRDIDNIGASHVAEQYENEVAAREKLAVQMGLAANKKIELNPSIFYELAAKVAENERKAKAAVEAALSVEPMDLEKLDAEELARVSSAVQDSLIVLREICREQYVIRAEIRRDLRTVDTETPENKQLAAILRTVLKDIRLSTTLASLLRKRLEKALPNIQSRLQEFGERP